MKIIFLGGLFPDSFRETLLRNSRGVVQNAADALQRAFVSGFAAISELTVVNLPFVGSFPHRYKSPCLPTFHFRLSRAHDAINVGFINLPLIKLISRYINARRHLARIIPKDGSEHYWIVVYSLHSPFLWAALSARILFKGRIRICVIVPDLPQHMSATRSVLYRVLKEIDGVLVRRALRHADAFVLLTDFMADELEVGARPWTRVEGIYLPRESLPVLKKRAVLYSGTLAERYGIRALVDAFELINRPDVELWVCGDGDYRGRLCDRSKTNPAIRYLGQLKREDALDLQMQALVLVNPRTGCDEYTRFSFPSKVLEYFASGTICVMHRLSGIPEEYFEHCVTPNTFSVADLAAALEKAIDMEEGERSRVTRGARDFVLQKKSPSAQCATVIKMLANAG